MFVNYKCENFICVYFYTINKKKTKNQIKEIKAKIKITNNQKKKPQKNNN